MATIGPPHPAHIAAKKDLKKSLEVVCRVSLAMGEDQRVLGLQMGHCTCILQLSFDLLVLLWEENLAPLGSHMRSAHCLFVDALVLPQADLYFENPELSI